MKRYRAVIEAYDSGVSECVITESSAVGADKVVHKFLVEVNVPEAKAALVSALHDAIYSMGDNEDEVREGYFVKLRTDGNKVDCSTRRTILVDSDPPKYDWEFDTFTVTGNPGKGAKGAMDVALCAVRGRLHGEANPDIVG